MRLARPVAHHFADFLGQLVGITDHLRRGDVEHHGRKHHAFADFFIGIDDDIDQIVIERDEPKHVLYGGDAAAHRFQRADQRADADLLF